MLLMTPMLVEEFQSNLMLSFQRCIVHVCFHILLRVYLSVQLYLNYIHVYYHFCLQCFDAVGWAAGRASGL